MLHAARSAWEAGRNSEPAALDLTELLIACELRREALDVLMQAGKALPKSERLERATLTLLERLGDERAMRDYLDARVKEQPGREDLRYRLIKAHFALGSREQAAQAFADLVGKNDPADRLARRLDLARSLRRMNLPRDAAELFRAVLDEAPERLDIRRELAETLLAAGDKAGARALMRSALSPEAEIENFLDVIGFMVQQEMLAEARQAIENRIEREPRRFEVAIALIDVLARLGEQKDGESRLETARALADTEARYRRWIEAAAAFHDSFESSESFFATEQSRLTREAAPDSGGWTPERAARFLIFCDVTRHGKAEPLLAEALKERLDDPNLPPELRTALHRLLVEALGRDPKNADRSAEPPRTTLPRGCHPR